MLDFIIVNIAYKLQDDNLLSDKLLKNSALYAEYKKLAEQGNNVIFGGRLGEYKYYDMDQVIAASLELSKREPG